MKLPRFALLLLFYCLAGCLTHQTRTDLPRQTDVFGIQLHSDTDYREINGVKGSEEPCLKGYERSFDPPGITIGYGFDRKIRKITTRSTGSALFGIVPGMSAEKGRQLALQAGLAEESPYRYQGNGITLTLLVDDKNRVFGMTVENID